MNYKELEEIFTKYLYLEDKPDFLKVVLATVIANRLDTIPVWLMVIANASAGKSEILGSLSGSKEVFMLSMISPASLISFDKQTDSSLLPKINGKVVVIRDASTLATIHPNFRSYVFSQLRSAFDGQLERSTGLGIKTYKAKFGMIVAATPAIEHFRSMESLLGERFLNFRPEVSVSEDVWEKIKMTKTKHSALKEKLTEAVATFLKEVKTPDSLSFPDEIKELSKSLALLRTTVLRDGYSKELLLPIEAGEYPLRCAKQMSALYTALLTITSHDEALAILRRVAKHSIPLIRIRVIKAILNNIDTLPLLANHLGLSEPYIYRIIEELVRLNAIEKVQHNTTTKEVGRGRPATKLIPTQNAMRLFSLFPVFKEGIT